MANPHNGKQVELNGLLILRNIHTQFNAPFGAVVERNMLNNVGVQLKNYTVISIMFCVKQ